MCAKCWLVFFQVFIVVASDKGGPRQSRFFTFNTVNDDIRIDLDFSVPFISIPVKKTVENFGTSLGLPTINVNPASLALGGVMVIATTVLIPFLVKNYAYDYPHRRYAKLLQVADFDNSEFLDFASQMLSDTRSVRGCALRVACWTGQMPDSTDFMRTWDQVLRNKLLSTMVNATAVHDAMLSGHAGRDCSTYNPCPLQEHHFPLLVKHITRVTRGEPES
ncbi:uncharacterized protein LOC135080520 isoform X1 [Ostrinia nubilalis]|uniref:uncharacterized protein LOC135080520 isoform X1 n=1 Tax=Ostrinia nubilalis TaxID=29057 RepID=UPI003082584F